MTSFASLSLRRIFVFQATKKLCPPPSRAFHASFASVVAPSCSTSPRRTWNDGGGVRSFSEKRSPDENKQEETTPVDVDHRKATKAELQNEDWEQRNNKSPEEMGIDASDYAHEIDMDMPDIGVGGGKVDKWYKEEGDVIEQGDVMCDVETEGFTFGMESDDEGLTIMGTICVPEGGDEFVSPGTPLCVILHKTKPEV